MFATSKLLSSTKRQLTVSLLFLIALLPSCSASPSLATVTGRVTIDGEAPNLEEFYVSFFGSDGKTTMGLVQPDGTYTVQGVALGDAKVCVVYNKAELTAEQEAVRDRVAIEKEENPVEPKSPQEAKELGEKLRLKQLERDRRQAEEAQPRLPYASRFADPRTSQLELKITDPRGQRFDIALTRE